MQDPDPRPAGRVRSSGKGQKEAHSPFLTSLLSDISWASLVAQMVTKMPAVLKTQVRSPGEGDDNPPQCSCLENFMDRGA